MVRASLPANPTRLISLVLLACERTLVGLGNQAWVMNGQVCHDKALDPPKPRNRSHAHVMHMSCRIGQPHGVPGAGTSPQGPQTGQRGSMSDRLSFGHPNAPKNTPQLGEHGSRLSTRIRLWQAAAHLWLHMCNMQLAVL